MWEKQTNRLRGLVIKWASLRQARMIFLRFFLSQVHTQLPLIRCHPALLASGRGHFPITWIPGPFDAVAPSLGGKTPMIEQHRPTVLHPKPSGPDMLQNQTCSNFRKKTLRAYTLYSVCNTPAVWTATKHTFCRAFHEYSHEGRLKILNIPTSIHESFVPMKYQTGF